MVAVAFGHFLFHDVAHTPQTAGKPMPMPAHTRFLTRLDSTRRAPVFARDNVDFRSLKFMGAVIHLAMAVGC